MAIQLGAYIHMSLAIAINYVGEWTIVATSLFQWQLFAASTAATSTESGQNIFFSFLFGF
jgi:hypothetical protein